MHEGELMGAVTLSTKVIRSRIAIGIIAVGLMVAGTLAWSGGSASADVPDPIVAEAFTAETCAGPTTDDPTQNTGYAVEDLTQVFGARLDSYNAGSVVPLYDAFGGSILINDDGTVNDDSAAYPPVCGVRYVASLDAAVSEWMFCTDREAQTCADTDADGNLVDHDGAPIAPMTELPTNSKLSADQEKLIAYLVQNGHSYAGTGNQSWGGVTEAQSGLGTNERLALQTLVWCISDPATELSDFATTCAANMDDAEQARLLAMIPDAPQLTLGVSGGSAALPVGGTAEFTVTTNVFNQAIAVAFAGVAANWSVCAGDATLAEGVLTVSGEDPAATAAVTLCATATEAGALTLNLEATPPSTEHIGWSQSINDLEQSCQVYATFREVQRATVSAAAQAAFVVGTTSNGEDSDSLAASGGSADQALMLALALLGLGAAAVGASRLIRARHRA